MLIENIELDKKFVREFIVTHGTIAAIGLIEKCFKCDMNKNIKDVPLRIMVWQITHSLHKLNETTKKMHTNIMSIQHLIDTSKDNMTKTMARHLISSIDKLEAYVS